MREERDEPPDEMSGTSFLRIGSFRGLAQAHERKLQAHEWKLQAGSGPSGARATISGSRTTNSERSHHELPWHGFCDGTPSTMGHADPATKDATKKPPERGGRSFLRTGSSPRWAAFSLAAAVLLNGSRALADDGVFVHIDSPVPAELVVWRGRTHYRVCESPCDDSITGIHSNRYVIMGSFPISSTFSLPDVTSGVTITVQPGSNRRFWGGYATLLGAVVIFPAPGVLLYLGGRDSKNAALLGTGIGLMVAGGVTATVGAVYLALGTTTVKLQKSGAGAVGRAAPVKPRYWMGEF